MPRAMPRSFPRWSGLADQGAGAVRPEAGASERSEDGLSIRAVEWCTYEKLHRFYFGHVQDPRREALLLQRIRESEAD